MKYDPVQLLIDDHNQLKEIMSNIEKESKNEKSDKLVELFKSFKDTFHAHDRVEDEIVYPVLLKHKELKDFILKGYQAHHMVEVGILELKITPFQSENWRPKFLVIKDCIQSHMTEEENVVFKKAKELLEEKDMESMGKKIHDSRAS